MDLTILYLVAPLILGWCLDLLYGDPINLPHPIVWFGKIISWGDKKLNSGKYKKLKGGVFSVCSILFIFIVTQCLFTVTQLIHPLACIAFSTVGVFFFLAGNTLRKEVKAVFIAVEQSLEAGRQQVARIVGRNTSQLTEQEIKTAALETLAENLSDGVIAPLFWFFLLGLPGMAAYKMINTLDSMIAYRSDKYKDFGCWAAYIDDIANYIPARLTALLMLIVSGKLNLLSFVIKYSRKHISPNSGYPESALAGILDCQFGGPNMYYGKIINKPYIGDNDRELTLFDVSKATKINLSTEVLMITLITTLIIVL